MTYIEHLNFTRIVNSAKWFLTFEAFRRTFGSYPEKLLIKAWKRAKGKEANNENGIDT